MFETETDWFKPICPKCPYFVNIEDGLKVIDVKDEGIDAGEERQPLMKCERPYNIDCLAESPLIRRSEIMHKLKGLFHLNRLANSNIRQIEAKKRARVAIPGMRHGLYKRGKIKRRK